MEEKKGLTPAQVEKLQDAVSKLEPTDYELLSDELDSVSGGGAGGGTSPEIIICVSGCAGS